MGLPVQLWIEWAFYDSAGAWKNKPAITAGVELPALPAAPGVALGLEYTHVSRHVQGHAIWYRHWWFHDGWVVEGEPLAHSLAGHGRQWLLEVTSELASADVRLTGRLLLRDRGEENLFAPDREGRSRGVAATAEWRPAPTLGVTAGWELERGDSGWEQSRGRLGARWLFGRVRP